MDEVRGKELSIDEELYGQMYNLIDRADQYDYLIKSDKKCYAKEAVEIAQQHTNSKLEELEKWVDENKFPASKEEDYIEFIYVPELESKIQSLKQQS